MLLLFAIRVASLLILSIALPFLQHGSAQKVCILALLIPFILTLLPPDDFTFSSSKRKMAEGILARRAKDEKRSIPYEFQDYKGR